MPVHSLAEYTLSEEYLTKRFSRPAKSPEKIVYEFTNDIGYLHQYYRLRTEMFIGAYGLKHFSGAKDEFDDCSDVMVARIGNHVIGGCRLSFSTPKDRKHLPMEKHDFVIEDQFSDVPLFDLKYAEISRMAILPEFQNSLVMLELSRQLFKYAAQNKARFVFTLAPVASAHDYRKMANLFGLNSKSRNDIDVADREEYQGIKMALSVIDLTSVYSPVPKAKQEAENPLSLVGA